MIINLDIEKTYGQQNEDVAKKNKITKVTLKSIQIEEPEDSGGSIASFLQNIDASSNSEEKIISSSNKSFPYEIDFLTANPLGTTSVTTEEFPAYVGKVLYKDYSISLDLNSPEYSPLKNATSKIPFSVSFSGKRSKFVDNNEAMLYDLGNDFALSQDMIPYDTVVSSLDSINLVDKANSLDSSARWTENDDIVANIVSDSDVSTNAYNEILDFIQTGADSTRKTDNRFLKLNDYIQPSITNWNNDGETLTFTLRCPHQVFLYGSESLYKKLYIVSAWLSYWCRLLAKSHEFYRYEFTDLTISFLSYDTSETEVSYFDGERNYSAKESGLFSDGIYVEGTPYTTKTDSEGNTSIVYNYYYHKNFSQEIYESYSNGKLILKLKFPIMQLTDEFGFKLLYSQNYGIIKQIGVDYFDSDGNKISLSTTDKITEYIQIPEGTLCRIAKNGESVYKKDDGSDKLFVVENSSLNYSGILVSELSLVESLESPVSMFDSMSWSEIDAIGKLGKLEKYFKVGDAKIVRFEEIDPSDGFKYSEDIPFVIIGFNHDNLSNGMGTAGITVGMLPTSNLQYQMNTEETNSGGWSNSNIRNNVLPDMFKKLPSGLQTAIKPVYKESTIGDASSTISVSEDKLFLLSANEITGVGAEGLSDKEGVQYEYYRTIKDGTTNEGRIKNLPQDYPITPVSYWLRSANTSRASQEFGSINRDGSIYSYDIATNPRRISFAFCLGEKPFTATLQEATWSQINNISRAGRASEFFSVGEEKTISLQNGESIVVRIIGFGQDYDAEGNPIGITFECKNVLNKLYSIDTSSGGNTIDESIMQTSTLPSIFSSLIPSEMSRVIKTANRKNGYYETSLDNYETKHQKYYQANLFLLEYGDVVDLSTNSYWDDYWKYFTNGTYEYYKTKNGASDRIKTKYADNTPIKWWLSTSEMNYSAELDGYALLQYSVDGTGAVQTDTIQSSENGLSFCFCV